MIFSSYSDDSKKIVVEILEGEGRRGYAVRTLREIRDSRTGEIIDHPIITNELYSTKLRGVFILVREFTLDYANERKSTEQFDIARTQEDAESRLKEMLEQQIKEDAEKRNIKRVERKI